MQEVYDIAEPSNMRLAGRLPWKVRVGNYPAGTEVKATGVNGIVLLVERQS